MIIALWDKKNFKTARHFSSQQTLGVHKPSQIWPLQDIQYDFYHITNMSLNKNEKKTKQEHIIVKYEFV